MCPFCDKLTIVCTYLSKQIIFMFSVGNEYIGGKCCGCHGSDNTDDGCYRFGDTRTVTLVVTTKPWDTGSTTVIFINYTLVQIFCISV